MNNRKIVQRNIILLTVFSIAMGLLESIVVVYLRQLYYPEGFGFPLKTMAPAGFSLECLRETSTVAMLIAASAVAGRSAYERFSYFLYSFGIWDIFYYVWLKILLNWPSSLLTWDILFLIPIVWVGPVLSPFICSVTMIFIAGCILFFQQKGFNIKIRLFDWALLFSGAFVIFLTFIWDYSQMIIKGGFIIKFFALGTDTEFQRKFSSFIASSYKWFLFIIGEILIICFLILFCKRTRSTFK